MMADYPPQAHENRFTYAADAQDDDATWMLGGCSDLDEFTVGSSHTCFLQNEKAQHRVNVKKKLQLRLPKILLPVNLQKMVASTSRE